jgi:hypothetical protein
MFSRSLGALVHALCVFCASQRTDKLKQQTKMLRRSAAAIGAALWGDTAGNADSQRVRMLMHVAMQVELHLDNAEPDETYDLFVFASRDMQQDQSLDLTTFNLKLKTPTNIDKLMRIVPKMPERINFWLYPTGVDADGCKSQTLLCSGYCLTQDLHDHTLMLELEDASHARQGDLIVRVSEETSRQILMRSDPEAAARLEAQMRVRETAFGGPSGVAASEATAVQLQPAPERFRVISHERALSPEPDPFVQQLIKATQLAYERFVNPDEGFFDAVDTQAGPLPAIGFVLLAAQIRVVPHRAELWMLHLHKITCERLALRASDVPQSMLGELFCEMCMWQVRAKIYVFDTVRSPNGGREGCDQWLRMGCFPNQALAGGDCEDFSVSVLEFFQAFCGLRFVSPLLNELQLEIIHYTACLAIGQLRTSKGFASHAYVLLLDSQYVRERHCNTRVADTSNARSGRPPGANRFRRALVLEGTCYTESTWRGLVQTSENALSTPNIQQQTALRRERETYRRQCRILDTPEFALNANRYERMIKFRMPASVVEQDRKYGKIFSLLTADFLLDPHTTKLSAMHWMLSTQNSENLDVPRIGVDHAAVAYYSGNVHLYTALQLSERQSRQLNRVLKDLPFSSFQEAPLYATPDVPTRVRDPQMLDRFDASPARSSHSMLFDMRWCDWLQYEPQIRRGFSEYIELFEPQLHSVEYQRLDVSRDIALMIIVVRRQGLAL